VSVSQSQRTRQSLDTSGAEQFGSRAKPIERETPLGFAHGRLSLRLISTVWAEC
jgi:hypothetical protein